MITPGFTYHQYRFEQEIGRGAFGVTWQAWQDLLERHVAIKVVNVGRLEKDGVARVIRECQIGGKLAHPHIATVYDAYRLEQELCIVMELLPGGNLDDYLGQHQPSLAQGLRWGLDLIDALTVVHAQGIIHRDLKPANILLTQEAQVKLADFGIAHLPGSTMTKVQPGTPAYHAPEQASTATIDAAADVYALSAVLFEIFSGSKFLKVRQFSETLPPPEWQDELAEYFKRAHAGTPDPLLPTLAETLARGLAYDKMERSDLTTLKSNLRSLLDSLTTAPVDDSPRSPKKEKTQPVPKAPAPQPLGPTDPLAATDSAAQLLSTSGTPVQINAGNIRLSPGEWELLAASFRNQDQIIIESELSHSRPGVRLLVVLPLNDGHHLARVIVKIAPLGAILREWQHFRANVQGLLPQETAHIQADPLRDSDVTLGLLRYSFPDVGRESVQNLFQLYQTGAEAEISTRLGRILSVLVSRWWLDQKAADFTLRQAYDRYLPVHAVIEWSDETQVEPLLLAADHLTREQVATLNQGQPVQGQGFRLESLETGADKATMWLSSASEPRREPLRLRLTSIPANRIPAHSGGVVPHFSGVVVDTRRQLLVEPIQSAYPDLDIDQATVVLSGIALANPLVDLEDRLDQRLSGMVSPTHGRLALENIVGRPDSDLACLIDFVDTGEGHNLSDLARLEAEVVARLLPLADLDTGPDLENQVVSLARALHTVTLAEAAPVAALQKPYRLLRAIRLHAKQCLRTSEVWDEYYHGLSLALLGAIPTLENVTATRIAFTWSAAVHHFSGKALFPPDPASLQSPKRALTGFSGVPLWAIAGSAVIVILLLAVFFSNSLRSWATSLFPSPTATVVAGASPPTFTAVPTYTSTPTDTPIPQPPPQATVTVKLTNGLNVYYGPDDGKYEVAGTASAGADVSLTGRDERGEWLQILYPAVAGGYGWIEARFDPALTAVDPATLLLATALPPPTVTSTPSNTPTPTNTLTPAPTATPTATPLAPAAPPPLPGTPTAAANQPRDFVEEVPIYLKFVGSLAGLRPTSSVFSPDGQMIATTEGAKLYTLTMSGELNILMEEDPTIRPVDGLVWSPNGQYLAFVADLKQNCDPCRRVGYVRPSNALSLQYIEPPEGEEVGLPRWTQDGRLLVTFYANNDPAGGATYVFDVTTGRQVVASGEFVLSSSNEGQQGRPWQPGREWDVRAGRADSYYYD